MTRRLTFVLGAAVAALVLCPLGYASYPLPYAAQGGAGVLSKDGSVRFVAVGAGESTIVSAARTKDRKVVASQTLPGSFGVPMLTQKGPAGGVFRDGETFILESTGAHTTTQFVLLATRDLAVRETLILPGTFAFDAVSPDGKHLYLIQHQSVDDVQHYVVRAYDLAAHRLLPGRVADKTQQRWVMQGFAASRVESPSGRWVYTLYANPGGYPFIHALDTVHGVAHCVGIPWSATDGDQLAVFNFALALKATSLTVGPASGRPYRVVDVRTWKVTRPTKP
jgi:hypothetical protein